MGWASHYIQQLHAGETVSFRPRGNSMEGKISSGQLVVVEPITDQVLANGDIVLCSVGGAQYLHLIVAQRDGRYQIGNNRGGINGWIPRRNIHGKVISVT